MDINKLCALAIDARKMSYAPYSNYAVGAALLSKSGKVFTGCNIENSAFSSTVCAERTAFFKAISEGETEFERIAIAAGNVNSEKLNASVTPCGVCRQVMREFCKDDFEIICVADTESFKKYTLKELLPNAFSGSNLK